MSERRDLVVVANTLPTAVRQRLEVAEFVGETLERSEIEAFFREFPDLFLDCLAAHYPLDAELLEEYSASWNWELLSANDKLPWSPDFVARFIDYWDWEDGLPLHAWSTGSEWPRSFLASASEPGFWREFSSWGRIPSIEMIREFNERIDFERLSWNESVPWSVTLVAEFQNRWDWSHLSIGSALPWSYELIDRFIDKWDWEGLSSHMYLVEDDHPAPSLACNWHWSLESIERYRDRWHWQNLSARHDLPWSCDLIDYFKENWDWQALSENLGLPWSVDLLERYLHRWHFDGTMAAHHSGGGLSGNWSLPWTVELIGRFKENWSYDYLSGNPSLPWSTELIDTYLEKWLWQTTADKNRHVRRQRSSLSDNHGLPWSIDLIDRYSGRWDWESLSHNSGMPYDCDLLDRYLDQWDFRWLSDWPSQDWSEEMLIRYQHRIDWVSYANHRWRGNMSRHFYRQFEERIRGIYIVDYQSFGIEKLRETLVERMLNEMFE